MNGYLWFYEYFFEFGIDFLLNLCCSFFCYVDWLCYVWKLYVIVVIDYEIRCGVGGFGVWCWLVGGGSEFGVILYGDL